MSPPPAAVSGLTLAAVRPGGVPVALLRREPTEPASLVSMSRPRPRRNAASSRLESFDSSLGRPPIGASLVVEVGVSPLAECGVPPGVEGLPVSPPLRPLLSPGHSISRPRRRRRGLPGSNARPPAEPSAATCRCSGAAAAPLAEAAEAKVEDVGERFAGVGSQTWARGMPTLPLDSAATGTTAPAVLPRAPAVLPNGLRAPPLPPLARTPCNGGTVNRPGRGLPPSVVFVGDSAWRLLRESSPWRLLRESSPSQGATGGGGGATSSCNG